MFKKELLDVLKSFDYVFPTLYTDKEGEELKVWKFGPVGKIDLEQRSKKVVNINWRLVHSFIFEDTISETTVRWDCVNGWNE
jgi:hypothetical protein